MSSQLSKYCSDEHKFRDKNILFTEGNQLPYNYVCLHMLLPVKQKEMIYAIEKKCTAINMGILISPGLGISTHSPA